MIKILKEKTAQKMLDQVQAKASARLANIDMVRAFVARKAAAAKELNTTAAGAWTIDSAVELGDDKPFNAGPRGGLRIEKSRTLVSIVIREESYGLSVEVRSVARR